MSNKKWTVVQSYLAIDYYRDIEADTEEKAIEIAMKDGIPDKQQTEDTETYAEEN